MALNIFKQSPEFYFEWLCTAVLIIGVTLTSYNVFPANIYFSLLGNLGWFVLGIIWRKWSLIVVQFIVTAIYVAGLINIWI